MSSTRPQNNRSITSRSHVEVLESPPLSATSSTSSTPGSIHGDQDPIDREVMRSSQDRVASREEPDVVERGRSPVVEREIYAEDDARSMSPRRNSEELERIGREAKAMLEQQAKTLQSGLLALLDRVDKVREEHDKLEGENRFLQEYIGSLMATSKITGDSGRNRNSSSRLK
ncbi:uncharacterized protein LAJ45_05721 [Morchella importuna]|uniref:uncharacterized protein n=1 Tax=Morchella importuna TaxID=1174673 RepID=UPI001E8EE4AE|nr:uncharacterized protein LAJ45_05721 [Morchella importuna]KAH8150035.1 hypothetical protein LAJ45_05721 [Morchella importuna]